MFIKTINYDHPRQYEIDKNCPYLKENATNDMEIWAVTPNQKVSTVAKEFEYILEKRKNER